MSASRRPSKSAADEAVVLHIPICRARQPQPGSRYDPAVKQIDAAFGVLCEARIVRDHADG
jgi:hypothetical protein